MKHWKYKHDCHQGFRSRSNLNNSSEVDMLLEPKLSYVFVNYLSLLFILLFAKWRNIYNIAIELESY